MLELSTILSLFGGIFIGMITGLLPSVPMALGMMIAYPFVGMMSVTDIFVYWTAIIIGSQFFGSVAAISTGIPGETSSMIYVKDVRRLGVADRTNLILFTARGSLLASVVASSACLALFALGTMDFMYWFNRIDVRGVIFAGTIALLIYLSRSKFVTMLLLAVGIAMGIKNNYALPNFWYPVQLLTENITFFVVALGLLIVPELFKDYDADRYPGQTDREIGVRMPWWAALRGSAIGAAIGLVPGPSATLSSTIAYNSEKSVGDKVTSAESANNSAMITSMLPLLLVGIPITVSEVLVLQMLQMKLIDWPELSDLDNIAGTLIKIQMAAIGLAAIYYFLSTRMIDIYARAIVLMQTRFRLVLCVIIAGLALLDFYYSELGPVKYLGLFLLFSAIGVFLDRRNIDPIPLLFGFILGDKVVWTALHLIEKYL